MDDKLIYALAGAVFIALALGAGTMIGMEMGGEPQEDNINQTDPKDAPQEVRESQDLAEDLLIESSRHFNNVNVYISTEGEIALEYTTTADSPSEVETEMHQIAKLYAEQVENESQARTLSIITGRVQAVVPRPTVEAYVRGDINEEAFLETVEITDVNRTDD